MPDPLSGAQTRPLLERLLAAEATLSRCDARLHELDVELQRPAPASLALDPAAAGSVAELQTLRAELERARGTIETLEARAESAEASAAAAEASAAQALARTSAAQAELDFAKEDAATAQAEVERLNFLIQRSSSMQEKYDAALDRIGELEAELEKARVAQVTAGVPEPVERTPSWDTFEQMQTLVQNQLLELEQLRGAKKDLGRLLDEWRSKARHAQQRYKQAKDRAEAAERENDSLMRQSEKTRKASTVDRARENKELDDLRKQVREHKRELQLAEKRNAHLRQKLSGRSGRG